MNLFKWLSFLLGLLLILVGKDLNSQESHFQIDGYFVPVAKIIQMVVMWKVFVLCFMALRVILPIDSTQLIEPNYKCIFILASAKWSTIAKNKIWFNENDRRLEKWDDFKDWAHTKDQFEAAVPPLRQLTKDWITLIVLFVIQQDR